MHKDYLTNEKLKGLFDSTFSLAGYAMALARYQIAAGTWHGVDALLNEIATNPTRYSEEQLEEMSVDAREVRQKKDDQERLERRRREQEQPSRE
jgi:hypothetical protein